MREKIEKWLDAIIEHKNALADLSDFFDDGVRIKACEDTPDILIHHSKYKYGIDELAKILDVEVKETRMRSVRGIKKEILYRGVTLTEIIADDDIDEGYQE